MSVPFITTQIPEKLYIFVLMKSLKDLKKKASNSIQKTKSEKYILILKMFIKPSSTKFLKFVPRSQTLQTK